MLRRCIVSLLCLLTPLPVAAQSENGAGQGPPPAPVVTAVVQEMEIRSPLSLVGTAEPLTFTTIAGEVSGRVSSISAREGEHVDKGESLLQLRTLPVELELQESQATLAEVQALLEKAADDMRRAEELFREGFISEEEFQSRTTEKKALQKQMQRIRATMSRLSDRLDRMEVKAPFAGQIVEKRTEIGQWVNAGDPVITLADLSTVKVRVPVPERHIGKINRGEEATVTFAGLPDRSFTGEVTAIIPLADTSARTFPVEISLANPDGLIMAGMLATATFQVGAPRTALMVPKDALVPQPGGDAHLFKVENGTAALVPVRTVGTHDDLYAIESLGPPIKTGDKVITRGNERIRPGQPVREASHQTP